LMWSRFRRLQPVREGIYCALSMGIDSNIYVVSGGDEIMVVDTGLGLATATVMRDMVELGLSPGKVKFIVNTHCHIDHIGGNKDFLSAAPDAKVMVHEADAKFMLRGDLSAIEPTGMLEYGGQRMRVDVMLREGSRISIGDYEFRVLHTPGHTPGCICLYDDEYKILFSGDTVFLDGVGRYDFPYSSYSDLLESLERLAKIEVETLLPGHGYYATRDGSRYIRGNLMWLRELGP